MSGSPPGLGLDLVVNMKPQRDSLFVASAVLATVLAGCASAGGAEDVSSPTGLAFDATGGAIGGIVVNTENVPIAGALVAIQDGAPTTTAEDGRFLIAGLAGGTYQVFAQALGCSSVARSVDVAEGETVDVVFTLEALPVEEPRIELLILKGFSVCDYMVYVISGRLPYPCDSGQAKSRFDVNVNESWRFLVVEMKWQGGFANSDTFRLFTADDGDCTNGSPCYGLVYGRGYARLEGEPGKTELVSWYDPWMDDRGPPYPENSSFLMVVNGQWIGAFADELGQNAACQAVLQAATGTGYKRGCLGVGVSTGIPYDLYVSIFHYMVPDPRGPCCPATTYSAVPDK